MLFWVSKVLILRVNLKCYTLQKVQFTAQNATPSMFSTLTILRFSVMEGQDSLLALHGVISK